eukprot:symbB.v1.2.019474.t1/scaffold1593.1/size164412/16
MSRVLDYAVWKEHVGRVQRQELARFGLPHSPIEQEMPFNRSFARGWPHTLYNDSSKTRMLLTPTGPGRGYSRDSGLTPRLGDFKESYERPREDSGEWTTTAPYSHRSPRDSRDSIDRVDRVRHDRHDRHDRRELRLPALRSEELPPRATPRNPHRSHWNGQAHMNAANREPARQSQAQPKISFDDSDTRTPSPSECGDPDSLNFDAKPEHTYLGITKEFGHMIGSSLQSNKWDRRCQALKSMLQVLKGLDLEGMAPPGSTGVLGSLRPRDPVRRWRLTCQLLHHVIRDKVMPVRLAALDLYQQAFTDLDCFEKAEVVFAAGVLVEHLIDRLGDSNVRLHEAARRCLVFTAEHPRLGPKSVLDRLREKLSTCPKGGERAKVHFGVLDTVLVLLEHFNEDMDDAYSPEEVAPFILAGLEDSAGSALATIVKFWTQRDRDQHRQSVESCVTLPEWETRPRSVCYWFKPIIIRERVDTANLLSFHQIWIAGHCNPKTSGLKP